MGVAGCGSGGSDAGDAKRERPNQQVTGEDGAEQERSQEDQTEGGSRKGELPPLAQRYADLDPADFDDASATIDNRYFPLTPGSRHVFEGSDARGKGRSSHRVEFVVTDLTQMINGVEATVVWERDFVGEDLEEAELGYFAQDTAGNVWHLGEYSEVYEDGELVGATGFLVGYLTGARAGIFMPAEPRTGTPSYSEGFGPPPINWNDRARVIATGRSTRVPAGKYDDVVVIEEYSESELTSFQLKYYAPGVGNVRVGWRGDDESQETLVLVRADALDADEMDEARAEAGALEERARMYGTPPPSERRPATR